MNIRILAVAGSARTGAYNQKLLQVMAEGAAQAGAEVVTLDWADYLLPVLNQDLEIDPRPDAVLRLRAQFKAADAFLFATPEHNGGYSAHIKNVIDWASRSIADDNASVFRGKPMAIAGATIGTWGCVRAVRQLREVLGYLGGIILPDTVSVSGATNGFAADGRLVDAKLHQSAQAVGQRLAQVTLALKASANS